jgi:hypothetical protein
MNRPRNPVIFAGMHRSGSSLLGRLVGGLGLFSGVWKDENDEAVFFLELNKRLLAQCGAVWDKPGGAAERFRDPAALEAATSYAAARVGGLSAALFLGPSDFLRYRDIRRLDRPWGWKDPRNTFTLPVWRNVFPLAKVLFLERHGVDVARSLEVRSVQTRPAVRLPWTGHSAASSRCSTLEGGLSLWAEYQAQARDLIAGLPPGSVYTLRYEQLLEQPAGELGRVAAFCGLDVSDGDVEAATATIRVERAYAYRRDERLVTFALNHAATLDEWGYSA